MLDLSSQPRASEKNMTTQEIIWGIELSPQQSVAILSSLPENVLMENHSRQDLDIPPEKEPMIVFVPSHIWQDMSNDEKQGLFKLESSQSVLILEGINSNEELDLEGLIAQNFITISHPLNSEQIRHSIEKTWETRNLYQDIYRMAQEISLERELLTRKNEQLDFLNKILTRASASLDPETILQQAQEDLTMLLEVKGLMGIFWETNEIDMTEAELYLPSNFSLPAQEEWTEYLLENAHKLSGTTINSYQHFQLQAKANATEPKPEPHQIIPLPMNVGNRPFGSLLIISQEASFLGQDKIQVLQSAANHLALALRNALLFRKVKAQADHDGLTRIFNRQHFDRRILEELKRHQRHKNELSMLLIDLDHFKKVNDTYGHQAGDLVLREMGRILQTTLRQSDFPARYGGEEFAVILPQTTENQAWKLAQRLRKKVSTTHFQYGLKKFRVTASIGISSIQPGALVPPQELIEQADQALYQAKAGGRNMVCSSAPPELFDAM